jgi:hypothetical protein
VTLLDDSDPEVAAALMVARGFTLTDRPAFAAARSRMIQAGIDELAAVVMAADEEEPKLMAGVGGWPPRRPWSRTVGVRQLGGWVAVGVSSFARAPTLSG